MIPKAQDGSPVALFELKWGVDTLWNCAYDLPKMALAVRERKGERPFLFAGSPSEMVAVVRATA